VTTIDLSIFRGIGRTEFKSTVPPLLTKFAKVLGASRANKRRFLQQGEIFPKTKLEGQKLAKGAPL